MLTAEAVIHTEHADRYLVRVCKHASKMGHSLGHGARRHRSGDGPPTVRHVDWSASQGTLSFDCGQLTMQAAPGTLTLRAEALDEANLRRIQNLVTVRLENFGRREGLTVSWRRPWTRDAGIPGGRPDSDDTARPS